MKCVHLLVQFVVLGHLPLVLGIEGDGRAGQREEALPFFFERLALAGVELLHDPGNESPVGLDAREIAAAAKKQRLRDVLLECVVGFFHYAVLVGLTRRDPSRLHLVVVDEALVALGKNPTTFALELVRGSREVVCSPTAR